MPTYQLHVLIGKICLSNPGVLIYPRLWLEKNVFVKPIHANSPTVYSFYNDFEMS